MSGKELNTVARSAERSESERLDSWKEIAAYLRYSERTVRRWESEGLPVHRHPHSKKATIFAYKPDIDAWWRDGHERLARVSSETSAASPFFVAFLSHWRSPLSLTVLALFLSLPAARYFWRSRIQVPERSPAVARSHIESIAVLPLQNFSADHQQEYLADGITEELISTLAKIGSLKVISRTSAMHYKDTNKTLPEIARELKVDTIVEGSVQRVGQRLKITAQLIRAANEQHLWAEEYERDSGDVLVLESEVARDIANEVKARLTPAERKRLASARRVDPEAHEAYLKGRFHWNKRTESELRKAIGFFEQAITKDAQYAAAYAGLADCNSLLAYYGFTPENEGYSQAKTAARKALELDESLAEAHTSLAFIKTFYDWDWAGAEAESRRAIELNPSYATAHQWYGDALLQMGRVVGAIAEEERALELDPLSLVIN